MENQPITSLLSECKRRKPSSRVSRNVLIRAYYFFSGGKTTVYVGLVTAFLMALEMVRTESGLKLLPKSLILSGASPVYGFLWVNATAADITSSLLDELLWVAKLVEKDVSRKLSRHNRVIVRIIRTYFWIMAADSFANLILIGTAGLMTGELSLPMPRLKSDLVGDEIANASFFATRIYQSIFLVYFLFGYTWVDGIFFGVPLISYSLLILLAEAFKKCCLKSEDFVSLIRAHQIVLKAGEACDRVMSRMLFISVISAVYLVVVTGFSVMTREEIPVDRYMNLLVCLSTMIRLGLIGDLITKASLDVADAVYQSPWTDVIHRPDIGRSVVLVTMRAQKPLHLSAGLLGNLSRVFIVDFLRALYTYFQALGNLM